MFATAELAGPAVAWAQRLPAAAREIEVKSRSLRYPVEHLSGAVQAVSRLVEISRPESVPRVDVVQAGILRASREGDVGRGRIGLMVGQPFSC